MRYETEKKLAERAVELGQSAKAEAFGELEALTRSESPLARRLAASAIGKLAGVVDSGPAVNALQSLLGDAHPQVRQYAAKALGAFGAAGGKALPDLRNLYRNPTEKDYVKRSVLAAGKTIREAALIAQKEVVHACRKCGVRVAPDEYARSQRFFQRTFCDTCFDETMLDRRNFETSVEDKKTIRTVDGTLVQSDGERRIAELLHAEKIIYRYDGRLRLVSDFQIRPDFYLPELDVYIEYWGLDTPRYKAGMYMKQEMYMQAGKKLVSIFPADKPRLAEVLREKLGRHMRGGWGEHPTSGSSNDSLQSES